MLSSGEKSFSKIKLLIDDCSRSCAKLMEHGCQILVKQPGYVSAGGERLDIEMMIMAILGKKPNYTKRGRYYQKLPKFMQNRKANSGCCANTCRRNSFCQKRQ
jgi:hypothetical protein